VRIATPPTATEAPITALQLGESFSITMDSGRIKIGVVETTLKTTALVALESAH
jgi:hypothetical protein